MHAIIFWTVHADEVDKFIRVFFDDLGIRERMMMNLISINYDIKYRMGKEPEAEEND